MSEYFDLNGDGFADAVDSNLDGYVDAVDTDGDGYLDTFDTNFDGVADTAYGFDPYYGYDPGSSGHHGGGPYTQGELDAGYSSTDTSHIEPSRFADDSSLISDNDLSSVL